MAHVLLSLACLATRRLPSLALIWVIDLLFSGGLVALVVFVGREGMGTCDAGGGPFGIEGLGEQQRGDVCKKLLSVWILGMAGCGLFIASGATVRVVHFTQRGSGGGGGRDVERGWAVEGWRLEDLGEGRRYPIDAWAQQVSKAASGVEDGGYDNQTPGPSRGGTDDVQGNSRTPPRHVSPAQRTSIDSTLSRTFEYDGNRRRGGTAAAQQSAQPNGLTSQGRGVRGRCSTDRGTQTDVQNESSDSARSPSAVLRARQVARRTLEGEMDVPAPAPAGDLWGIGADDKKSLPSRAARGPTTTKQPTAAGRESWESWETDRRSTSSEESVPKGGVAAPTRNVRTPDRQITDPDTLWGTGAPSRPLTRRVRSGDRLSPILRRPTLPHLLGVQSKRSQRSAGSTMCETSLSKT